MTLLKVLCTVVIIGPYGNRDVRQLDGYMVKEAGDSIYVDFSPELIEPQVRWVKENDCTYYGHPDQEYHHFLRLKKQWQQETEQARKKFHQDLLREASKRKK